MLLRLLCCMAFSVSETSYHGKEFEASINIWGEELARCFTIRAKINWFIHSSKSSQCHDSKHRGSSTRRWNGKR
jgi:hypothetical protein